MIGAVRGAGCMFSIIIATHDSERALVPTLAALVPGATAGIVREVIVADGGSRDQTEQVADIAGCRFLASAEPLGARLKAAAAAARGDWLMFLRPGVVPGADLDRRDDRVRRSKPARRRAPRCSRRESGALAALRRALGLAPRRCRGLIIRKIVLRRTGRASRRRATRKRDLLRRIGRRRLVTLRTTVDARRIFDSVNQLLDTVTDPAKPAGDP